MLLAKRSSVALLALNVQALNTRRLGTARALSRYYIGMTLIGSADLLLPPREAAARIGVAPSTLRRLATIYSNVYGPNALPWSDGGRGGGSRLWTGEAVERTRTARELVVSGRASSFELALRMLKDAPVQLPAPAQAPAGSDAALEELRREVERLRAELEEVRGEVDTMRALPASAQLERLEDASETAGLKGRAEPERVRDGVLVRSARWVERFLRHSGK